MKDTPDEPKAQDPVEEVKETPETTENKPEVTPPEETVTIPKKKFEQLEMASNLNSKLQKRLNRFKSGTRTVKPSAPQFTLQEDEVEEEESQNQQAERQQAEQARFQNGLMKTIVDNPQYQKLLTENEVLRRVISSNPLSLLDADNPPADADEALEQVTDYLDEQIGKTDNNKKIAPMDNEKPPVVNNPPDNAIPSEKDKEKPAPKKDDVMGNVQESIMKGIS
jgi:hypothetical protein